MSGPALSDPFDPPQAGSRPKNGNAGDFGHAVNPDLSEISDDDYLDLENTLRLGAKEGLEDEFDLGEPGAQDSGMPVTQEENTRQLGPDDIDAGPFDPLRNAGPTAHAFDGDPPGRADSDPKTGPGAFVLISFLAAGLALLTSGFSLWLAYSDDRQVQSGESMGDGYDSIVMDQALKEINRLNRQMDTLTKKVEALSSSVEANKQRASGHVVAETRSTKERRSRSGISSLSAKKPAASRKAEPAAASTPPAGPAVAGGEWVVNLSSHSKFANANKEASRLEMLGLKPEVARAEVGNGKVWFRVRVTGFSNAGKARAYRDYVKRTFGIQDSWIGRK